MSNRTCASLRVVMPVCLVGAGLIGTAAATEPTYLTQTVPTADLDLAAPAGVAILHRRIAVAARNVCAWVDPGQGMDSDAFVACVTTTIREASAQTLAMLAKASKQRVMVAGTASAH